MSYIYACENCDVIGPISAFQGECRAGWTHGRLTFVRSDGKMVPLGEITDFLRQLSRSIDDGVGRPFTETIASTLAEAANALERRYEGDSHDAT